MMIMIMMIMIMMIISRGSERWSAIIDDDVDDSDYDYVDDDK